MCTGILNDVSNRVFSDRRFALFASLLDVSTKILPPVLLESFSASVCFGFVTITAQRLPQNALPAAAVVVLQRCHSRCSLLRATDAAVVPSDLFRAVNATVAQSYDSSIRVDAIAATFV